LNEIEFELRNLDIFNKKIPVPVPKKIGFFPKKKNYISLKSEKGKESISLGGDWPTGPSLEIALPPWRSLCRHGDRSATLKIAGDRSAALEITLPPWRSLCHPGNRWRSLCRPGDRSAAMEIALPPWKSLEIALPPWRSLCCPGDRW
jgi:hypothetical protein